MHHERNLYHITHWKAGSQWIYKILQQCAPEKIVPPIEGLIQVKSGKISYGRIYPTLYVSYQQFTQVHPEDQSKRLVIIRDLRDTLISWYYSMKVSHPIESIGEIKKERAALLRYKNIDDALVYIIRHGLVQCAIIQHSWYIESEPLIRYESLLHHDVEILSPVISSFVDRPEKEIDEIIKMNRFERITGNRERGNEDIHSHERKAMPGDWKNYFSIKVKSEFKKMYGDLLIKTGYEKNNNW